jgi:hypothetical protein
LEFKSKCPCQQPELSRFSARGLKPTRRLENVRGEGPNHAPIALRLASAFRGNKSNQFDNSGVLRLSYLQLLFIRTASPLELPERQCKDLERREDLREPQNSQPQTAFAICLHLRPMVGQPRAQELDAITKTRLRRLTYAYSIASLRICIDDRAFLNPSMFAEVNEVHDSNVMA